MKSKFHNFIKMPILLEKSLFCPRALLPFNAVALIISLIGMSSTAVATNLKPLLTQKLQQQSAETFDALQKREKEGLSLAKAKKYQHAAQIYKSLAQSLKDKQESLTMLRRAYQLHQLDYQVKKDPKPLAVFVQTTIERLENQDFNVLPELRLKAIGQYRRDLKALMDKELKRRDGVNNYVVKLTESHIQQLQQKLQTTQNPAAETLGGGDTVAATESRSTSYNPLTEGHPEVYTEKLADYLAGNKDVKKALGIYMDLSLNAKDASIKSRAINKAIIHQSQIAEWPLKTPWDMAYGYTQGQISVKTKQQRELETLLALYDTQAQDQTQRRSAGQSASMTWENTAQRGVLLLALQKRDDAFTLWGRQTSDQKSDTAETASAIYLNPRHIYADKAVGIMLQYFYDKNTKKTASMSDYSELERLARHSLAQNMKPVVYISGLKQAPSNKKSKREMSSGKLVKIYAADMLAIALLDGGKAALKASDTILAEKKLAEFTGQFVKHKRRDEGLFFLAEAQFANKKYEESLATTTSLTETYPKSTYMRQGLYLGGERAAEMGFEEHAFRFNEKFLSLFKKGEDYDKVNERHIALSRGKGYYRSAIVGMEKKLAKAKGSDKSVIALDILEQELRFGDSKRAQTMAENFVKDKTSSDELKSFCLTILAQKALEQGHIKNLKRYQSEAAQLSLTESYVVEAKASVAYALAEILSPKYLHDSQMLKIDDDEPDFQSISSKNPETELNRIYNDYQTLGKNYSAVCQMGPSSFCVMAKFKQARAAEKLGNSIDRMSIAETLDDKTVASFQKRKADISDVLNRDIEDLDAQALAMYRSQPQSALRSQIAWHNDFEELRLDQETPHKAYVQYDENEE